MKDVIIILILAAIAIGIVGYIVKTKKSGQTCIGCSHGKKCTNNSSCHCGCGAHNQDNS